MPAERPDLALDTIAPIATRWVASARAAVSRDDALREAALTVNFAWARVAPSEQARLLAFIADHFRSIADVLDRREALFRIPDPRDVKRWFGESTPPAYAWNGHVYFTGEFRPYDGASGFGPSCLAAMVVHECVHVFDARSGEAEIHVSEWDEPRFSALPPLLQVHNPSAYASFAAQAHHQKLDWPRDVRFGAGRRAD